MNFNHLFKYKWTKKLFFLVMACLLFLQTPVTAFAVDLNEEFELRKTLPIQSNEIENWPDGPIVGAQGAILMEANTGTILYEKNIHEKLYPASTTKIMTCLLAIENCSLDEMVTFSADAVFGIEPGSSNAGIDVGEQISMEECLYIILMYSANEVTAGVGEHIAGSMDAFIDMMNQRAKELGCLNTHFNNSNGLPDEEHYTTPYDLALIAKEFYEGTGVDFLVIPGEEVHSPDNPAHIINLGGDKSVNDWWRDHEDAYRAAVEKEMETMPEPMTDRDRYAAAASQVMFDKIREANGLAVLCHPHWIIGNGFNEHEDVTEYP